MKLQTKIISTVIIISILLNSLFLISFISNKRKEAFLRLEQKMERTGELLNHVNSGPLYDYDIKKLETNLKSFLKDSEIRSIALYETLGDVELYFEKQDMSDRNLIEVKTILYFNEQNIGEIITTYSSSPINLEISKSLNQLVITLIFVTLMITLALYILLKRITRPIDDLTELSSEIANGNLDKTINIDRDDEIGTLASSFMKMRDSIKQKIYDLYIENERREQTLLRTRKQQEAILQITSQKHFDKDWIDFIRMITFNACEALNVERTSVWLFNDDHSAINLENLFQSSTGEHQQGMILEKSLYPNYFNAMESESIIDAHDALRDNRTSEFGTEYLPHHGISSLLDAPIQKQGIVIGVLCFEQVGSQRTWTTDENIFAERLAVQIGSFIIEKDRRGMVEALQAEKEFTDTAMDSQQDTFFLFDPSTGKALRWNQAFRDITGYSDEEIARLPAPASYYGPDDLKRAEIFVQDVIRTGKGMIELELICKDGSRVPTEYNVSLIKDETGNPRYFISIGRDITQRRKTEKDMQNLRNYLSNIINSMPSMLVVVDAEYNVTLWNKTAEQRTGIHVDEALGKPLSEIYPFMPLEIASIEESIHVGEIKQEKQRSRQTEEGLCYEDITVYPLTSDGVDGAVIRIDDVTEIVRLEEIMIQSEKMLSVGGLAAGMAHEINNPLAGMIQTANVMADRLQNASMPANIRAAEAAGISMEAIEEFMVSRNIPQMLKAISDSGIRAAEIVGNMLSFSRKGESMFSSHDLPELMDRILELASTDYDLKKQYDFKAITIVKDYEDNLPLVPCEGAKIQQVLLNILRNGAEAMNEYKAACEAKGYECAEPRFILRMAVEKAENMVRIEIEDNGPGMDETTRRRIFEPFFTTKNVGKGTGLGLSVSFFIISENHRGNMAVESEPGKGAKFIIRLPLNGRSV